MASTLLTLRDLEILTALDIGPLTARQLLKVSQTFDQPFTTERYLRKRLQALCESGRVRRWRYATAGRSAPDSPNYYMLTALGFKLLRGPDATPPTKRYFAPVAPMRQQHAHALAEFMVHTTVCATRRGIRLSGLCRENTFWLPVGEEILCPDAAFQLIAPDGREFSFFLEIENNGQRMRSQSADAETWERKVRLYEAFQDGCKKRFRVLVVTTRQTERLGHILGLAASLTRNPDRSIFYGTSLPHYLDQAEAVSSPCFLDHRGRRVALVPKQTTGTPEHQKQFRDWHIRLASLNTTLHRKTRMSNTKTSSDRRINAFQHAMFLVLSNWGS
jgi:hypothetical protein